jgi:hypothetical protein
MKPTAQQTEIRNEVIDVMIKQLGGTKFFLMTGCKPQYKDISTDSPLIALKLNSQQKQSELFHYPIYKKYGFVHNGVY